MLSNVATAVEISKLPNKRNFDEEAIKRGVRERRAVQAHPQLPPGGVDQLREWQRDWTAEQIRHHKRKKDRYRAVIKTHV